MSFKARHARRAVVAGAAYDIFQGGGIIYFIPPGKNAPRLGLFYHGV